jgi:hypothetical protein
VTNRPDLMERESGLYAVEEILDALVQRRKDLKLRQVDVATWIEVDARVLSCWERRKFAPQSALLWSWIMALELPVSFDGKVLKVGA